MAAARMSQAPPVVHLFRTACLATRRWTCIRVAPNPWDSYPRDSFGDFPRIGAYRYLLD